MMFSESSGRFFHLLLRHHSVMGGLMGGGGACSSLTAVHTPVRLVWLTAHECCHGNRVLEKEFPGGSSDLGQTSRWWGHSRAWRAFTNHRYWLMSVISFILFFFLFVLKLIWSTGRHYGWILNLILITSCNCTIEQCDVITGLSIVHQGLRSFGILKPRLRFRLVNCATVAQTFDSGSRCFSLFREEKTDMSWFKRGGFYRKEPQDGSIGLYVREWGGGGSASNRGRYLTCSFDKSLQQN